MANLVVCDKCGVSTTDATKFMHIRGYRLSDATNYMNKTENRIDVCKDCYNKIFNKKEGN